MNDRNYFKRLITHLLSAAKACNLHPCGTCCKVGCEVRLLIEATKERMQNFNNKENKK